MSYKENIISKFEKENKRLKLINEGNYFYIQLNTEKIKGYDKLSEPAKQIFQKIYKSHNASQGLDYKKDWIPVKIREHKHYLEVHFKNKEWLHYLPNGEWY